ncbi:MAG: TIM barrel protein [Planctomycetes bacterium]|nr:TIM barrel protein [Planctomycetota bacterium]
MSDPLNRRAFLKMTASASTAIALSTPELKATHHEATAPLFKISLAEWCLNKPLFSGATDHLDFARLAHQHGIHAVEYVNQFFMDKAKDKAYLREMKSRASGEGVRSVLIMCDREGQLGEASEKERVQTVENHKKWVEAAKFLGCHSIRVNGHSSVKWSPAQQAFDESQKWVAEGLHSLCEFSDGFDIDVMIENHGGFSSHGKWLAGTIRMANHPRAGTLPDFGNFRLNSSRDGTTSSYDAYQGVAELMPLAKGVSVKTTVWDGKGQQHPLDYRRMMKIVLDAGYRGYCGIEHVERGREWQGIVTVKDQLIKIRDALAADYI